MEEKIADGVLPVDLYGKAGIAIPDAEILAPGELGATYELVLREGIFDPNGKVMEHIGPKISESYVHQYLDMLYVMFCNIAPNDWYLIKDTSGINRSVSFGFQFWNVNAVIGNINAGIVIGTGNVAPTNADYALGNQILHDSSPPTSGRLQYGAVTFGAPSTDNVSVSQFTITRNFANSSGAQITAYEIGLYNIVKRVNTNLVYFMTIRDQLAGGVAIPNGQTLTVNYRPQCQV